MLCVDCGQTDQLVWSGVVALSLGVPEAAGRLCLTCAKILVCVNKMDKVIHNSDSGLITLVEEEVAISGLLSELHELLASYNKTVEPPCNCECLCALRPSDFGLVAWDRTVKGRGICPDCDYAINRAGSC